MTKELEDADNGEEVALTGYESKPRIDPDLDLILEGSPCSYSSPTSQNKSSSRHSQSYRTLQSHSTATSRPPTTAVVSAASQRDLDLWHSKRWHTAPKEKHKVRDRAFRGLVIRSKAIINASKILNYDSSPVPNERVRYGRALP